MKYAIADIAKIMPKSANHFTLVPNAKMSSMRTINKAKITIEMSRFAILDQLRVLQC